MAPEQVKGKVMDGRADIWAFGCLVFEMLAGCRAFPGATNSDTIAKLLEREPDWQALPTSTPPSLPACSLVPEKDAKRRLHSIADARFEIDESLVERASPERHAHRKEWFAGVIARVSTTTSFVAQPLASADIRDWTACPLTRH